MKADKELGFGFIKKNSARPCTVQYWSEEGLRLYHALDLGEDILFLGCHWQGCKIGEDGKRLLYYELALRQPVKGKWEYQILLCKQMTKDYLQFRIG